MTHILTPCCSYSAGHPWYYLLGGGVPTPKQIRAYACARADKKGYRGYLADKIDAAHPKQEPQRSEALRQIKARVISELCNDISRYREVCGSFTLTGSAINAMKNAQFAPMCI